MSKSNLLITLLLLSALGFSCGQDQALEETAGKAELASTQPLRLFLIHAYTDIKQEARGSRLGELARYARAQLEAGLALELIQPKATDILASVHGYSRARGLIQSWLGIRTGSAEQLEISRYVTAAYFNEPALVGSYLIHEAQHIYDLNTADSLCYSLLQHFESRAYGTQAEYLRLIDRQDLETELLAAHDTTTMSDARLSNGQEIPRCSAGQEEDWIAYLSQRMAIDLPLLTEIQSSVFGEIDQIAYEELLAPLRRLQRTLCGASCETPDPDSPMALIHEGYPEEKGARRAERAVIKGLAPMITALKTLYTSREDLPEDIDPCQDELTDETGQVFTELWCTYQQLQEAHQEEELEVLEPPELTAEGEERYGELCADYPGVDFSGLLRAPEAG